MNAVRRLVIGSVCFVVMGTTLAGDLNPPAGPVAPTMKTIQEAEPRIAINAVNTPGNASAVYRITQPGSYYLTESLTVVSTSVDGIKILADGVTIDLMGFELIGPGSGARDGINTSSTARTGIKVRNGTVRGWGSDGVSLLSPVSVNCVVEGVSAISNGGRGIAVGQYSSVRDCLAHLNGSAGISTWTYANVSDCTASDNGGDGFSVLSGSRVSGCVSFSNGGNGFVLDNSSVVDGSTSTFNGIDGFLLSSGGSIMGCVSSLNTRDGIRVFSDCFVQSNVCDSNGNGGDGAGIRATSVDNRIEGNNCTTNDRGIDVNSSGNFIARNTCSGNTLNWDVNNNNICLVVSATTSGPISGNSGGVSPGSTDPNANFTY